MFNIYYLTYDIFSGLPKPIVMWYLLEANIVDYFKIENKNKKYWVYENINSDSMVFYCQCCGKSYGINEIIEPENLLEDEKRIKRILGVEFCKKDRTPMLLMQEKKLLDLSKIRY